MNVSLKKGNPAPKAPDSLKFVLREGYAAPAAPANLRSIDVTKLNIRSAVPSKPSS